MSRGAFQYQNSDDIVQLLSDLIGIASHRHVKNYETDVNTFIAEWFDSRNVPVDLVDIDYAPIAVARLGGSGGGYSLMLNVHTDTASVDSEEELNPKFNGKSIRGRGAVDAKGPASCMMYAMSLLKYYEKELVGDLIFAAVTGEEGRGSLGSRYIALSEYNTDFAIVGEPTTNRLGISVKGLRCYKITVKGRSVHSSSPERGINAIFEACRLVESLKANAGDSASVNISRINGGKGGRVPDSCSVYVEFRHGTEYGNVDDILSASVRGASLTEEPEIYVLYEEEPYCLSDREVIVEVSKQTLESLGLNPNPTHLPFWSDASILNQAGIKSITLGPGEWWRAHTRSENIDVKDLIDGINIYTEIAWKVCTKRRD